ncbi:SMP-30/gluconolactonase/LRE family protein [Pseudophaeobacter sp. EL27]|uniref:SMP-30/gluconolactonase/LRE family protein n=1 Tax=Pseudophaeobacter sp. EL27 TaxID=2107580 RepID=UPI000EFC1670|nr:SMP-30/gluconolactonase/LRE family protein [Pseudophaeobacter sp. EL27]
MPNVRALQSQMSVAFLTLATCLGGAASAADLPAPEGLSDFLEPDAAWELVYSAACFTEGIAASAKGDVYFSDIMSSGDCSAEGHQEGAIFKYDAQEKQVSLFRSPSGQSNGLYMAEDGDLYAAQGADFGGRRISRIDAETGRAHIIAHSFQGRRLNSPNDLTMGPGGLIYFSDPRYAGHETIEQPIQGVYRVENDGSVTLVVADAVKPNGIAFSPDGSKLYVAAANDNSSTDYTRHAKDQPVHAGLMAVLEYPMNDDGTLGARSILIDYAQVNTFGPDGLNTDKDGNLYVALFGVDDPGVYVYSPTGDVIGHLPTGEVWPTNTEFVRDPDGTTYLYMTGGADLYRIKMK